MKDCSACAKAISDYPVWDRIERQENRVLCAGYMLAGSVALTLVGYLGIGGYHNPPSNDPGEMFAALVLLAITLGLGGGGSASILISAFFARKYLLRYKRDKIVGYYLYHHLTHDGTYHHHDYDPRRVMGEADNIAVLCRIAHGGWFKRNEVVTSCKPASNWKIESAAASSDGQCWLGIQSVKVTDNSGILWPSQMMVPADQALIVMSQCSSADEFVESALFTKYAYVNLCATATAQADKITVLQRERRETNAKWDAETERVDDLLKRVIRMLNLLEAMKATVGRTKHAQALKQPLEDMLESVGDTDRVDALKEEVAQSAQAP